MRRPFAFRAPAPRTLRPHKTGAAIWAGALALAAFGLTPVGAQPVDEPRGRARDTAQAAPPTVAKTAQATRPAWDELTAEQQQALQPLASHWHALNAGHKRKWLALSRNYAKMSADDQTTLHSRMIEWAALSNRQRAQARLNFAEVKRVPADERKAKWEQYQALSEDEKRRLADRAPTKPQGAAIPVRPVPAQKLVTVPAATPTGQHTPRILLAPPSAPAPVAVPAAAVLMPPAAAGRSAASQPIPAEAQVLVPSSSTPAGSAVEQPSPP
jgi:hypothetical protein